MPNSACPKLLTRTPECGQETSPSSKRLAWLLRLKQLRRVNHAKEWQNLVQTKEACKRRQLRIQAQLINALQKLKPLELKALTLAPQEATKVNVIQFSPKTLQNALKVTTLKLASLSTPLMPVPTKRTEVRSTRS